MVPETSISPEIYIAEVIFPPDSSYNESAKAKLVRPIICSVPIRSQKTNSLAVMLLILNSPLDAVSRAVDSV